MEGQAPMMPRVPGHLGTMAVMQQFPYEAVLDISGYVTQHSASGDFYFDFFGNLSK